MDSQDPPGSLTSSLHSGVITLANQEVQEAMVVTNTASSFTFLHLLVIQNFYMLKTLCGLPQELDNVS